MEAIRSHGVCPEHRRSFGPVAKALGLDIVKKKPASSLNHMLADAASGAADEGAAPAGVDSTPKPRSGSKAEPDTAKKLVKKRARDSASPIPAKGNGAKEDREADGPGLAKSRVVK